MFHMAVSDIDKAKAFYADTLGFNVTNEKAYGGKHWVSLELPGGGASINLTTEHEHMKPGAMKLYLSSPDVEAAYRELIAKGVKPNHKPTDGWGNWPGFQGTKGKWFDFNDPDGNQWLIVPK